MSSALAVFAGTTEGRLLGKAMSRAGIKTLLFVATDYGLEIASAIANPNLHIHTGRLDSGEMAAMLTEQNCKIVLDATHPYAEAAGANIKAAVQLCGLPCLRLTRAPLSDFAQVETVPDMAAAAALLDTTGERALLTVGSKELDVFTSVRGYADRLFPRVLPCADALEKCRDLGFSGKQLICMQGPFSHEMNVATIRDLGIDCLVSKDSGATGGLYEKLSAVRETGIRMILIGRNRQEDGLSLDEAEAHLRQFFALPTQDPPEKRSAFPAAFPLFFHLEGKQIVVIGAGRVAARRIRTLLDYGCAITVVAPRVEPSLKALEKSGRLRIIADSYRTAHLDGAYLVLTATDDSAVNAMVAQDAAALGVPVNRADSREQCDFLFPAVAESDALTVGIVSRNNDHALVKRVRKRISMLMEENQ